MRLGVFLPNWIGDAVMATPALDSLRSLAGPSGRVVGVMRPYVADVVAGLRFSGLDLFDRRVFYKPQAKDRTLRGRAVIAALREERLDAIVLMTNSLRTAWVARRSGAAERIGYARDGRSWLLTTQLREPVRRGKRTPLPAIDSLLNLAYAAGGEWRPPTLRLATTNADEAAADAVWQRFGWSANQPVIVLNSGGAYGDAKSWPAEHFATLAGRIAAETDHSVLVNCGPGERETAGEIAAAAASPRVRSLGEVADLPIGLSKAVIRRGRALVTTDSGPRFFGVAFARPVVSLFGPTDPDATRTHSPHETPLSLSLACQFCWKRSCPLGHHRCLRDLSVDRVFATLLDRLDTARDRRAAA
ncbi:MAG: lipopolysaccharide heptosyltransferase II [Planctomycetota bacterium]